MERQPIVLIENHHMIRHMIEETLRVDGYPSVSAADGEEGLELIRLLRPPLVMCTLKMPGLWGHQVVMTMRNDPALSHIPFVLYTEDNDIETEVWSGTFDALLQVPFDLDDALRIVERLMNTTHEPFPRGSALILHKLGAPRDPIRQLMRRLQAGTSAPVVTLPSRLDEGGINRDIFEGARAGRLLIVQATEALLKWRYAQHAMQYFGWHRKPILCLMLEDVPLPDSLNSAHVFEHDEVDKLIAVAQDYLA